MKKAAFSLLLIAIVSFTVGSVVSTDFGSNETINTYQSSAQLNSDDQEINKSFHKIAALKYNVKKCNCKHKSEAFADVLAKKNAKNIYLITIEHESRQYSHMVVSWEGKVYDATITPSVYGMDEKEYMDKISKSGFNGLRVKTPYQCNK